MAEVAGLVEVAEVALMAMEKVTADGATLPLVSPVPPAVIMACQQPDAPAEVPAGLEAENDEVRAKQWLAEVTTAKGSSDTQMALAREVHDVEVAPQFAGDATPRLLLIQGTIGDYVEGRLLMSPWTAFKGVFPMHGTYFLQNEVFEDEAAGKVQSATEHARSSCTRIHRLAAWIRYSPLLPPLSPGPPPPLSPGPAASILARPSTAGLPRQVYRGDPPPSASKRAQVALSLRLRVHPPLSLHRWAPAPSCLGRPETAQVPCHALRGSSAGEMRRAIAARRAGEQNRW